MKVTEMSAYEATISTADWSLVFRDVKNRGVTWVLWERKTGRAPVHPASVERQARRLAISAMDACEAWAA